MAAEKACAKAVKGGNPATLVTAQFLRARAHFVGRFVRERNRQDAIGRIELLVEVGDPMRDDSRFAAASSGQNQEGSAGVEYGFTLLGIEMG